MTKVEKAKYFFEEANLKWSDLSDQVWKGEMFRSWVTNFEGQLFLWGGQIDQTWVPNLEKAKFFFEEANLTRLERPTLKG